MATTDTRSGFRLPWSSERNHDATAAEETPAAAGEAVAEAVPAEPAEWPSTDVATPGSPATGALSSETQTSETQTTAPVAEEPAMLDLQPSPAQPAAAPRKPTKLMADLTAAIRSTAESARDQALVQLGADASQVVETIRSASKESEATLRARSDQDIAGIKEWSRAEIARIKEETERRIEARKLGLDEELAAHAAAIEERVIAVESTVAAYRSEMDAYAERLGREDDPARLATLAELMPEPPALASWADLTDLTLEAETPGEAAPTPEPVVEEAAVEEAVSAEAPVAEPEAMVVAEQPAVAEPVAMEAEADATAEADADGWSGDSGDFPADVIAARLAGVAITEPTQPEPVAMAAEAADASDDVAVGLGAETVVNPAPSADPVAAVSRWGEAEPAWGRTAPVAAVATAEAAGEVRGWGDEDTRGWAAGATPGSGAAEDDQVDRGAIMAALEAAAEAVVAEESAESAGPASAAADELDPEAAGDVEARIDAGGFEASFADRLASLLPASGDGATCDASRTTQVVVSGLVSVASIASFKRHLGRLAGVQGVAVASGPEGDFVFNVTHRADATFRDAIPTLPGFAARVTSAADGVVQVTARDPEAEG